MRKLTTPLTNRTRAGLRCGEEVLLTGTLYTARDAAHRELAELARKKRRLPFELKGAVIYYAGPTPARDGSRSAARLGSARSALGLGGFGSCGPTTSARMDKFTPLLLRMGLGGMIGKGRRSDEVRRAIKKRKAVYFLAIGGAGAYLAKRIISAEALAFKKLGPEAIYKIEVRDFPLIVGIDSKGNDIYQ